MPDICFCNRYEGGCEVNKTGSCLLQVDMNIIQILSTDFLTKVDIVDIVDYMLRP